MEKYLPQGAKPLCVVCRLSSDKCWFLKMAEGKGDLEALIEEGKNKPALSCLHCPSRILNPKMGTYVEKEFKLPVMRHKKDAVEETEILKDFFLVTDKYHFENIGFSLTIDNIKYLACADCDIGPVGWHDMTANQSYVAVNRVKTS